MPLEVAHMVNTTTTRDLLCEGACNPGLGALDAALAAERRHEACPAMPDEWKAAMRQQVHTPHTRHRGGQWACAHCGTTRAY